MKTLNKVALSISMLLSLPAFAVSNVEMKKGFFVKASEKAQAFTQAAKAKVVNGYNVVKPKVQNGLTIAKDKTVNGFNFAKDTVVAKPKTSIAIASAAVLVPVLGRKLYTEYKAQVANNAQVEAKAELLKAVQSNQDATVAFNKLNSANKAAVQSTFTAFNRAQTQLKKAPTPKTRRRAQNNFNKAKNAFVNAINAIQVEKSAKSKAQDLYATAKAKTKSAFATAKDFAKFAFAKVKEHKKKAIAAAIAAAYATYEGVSYKWFKKNPATLVRGFQKAKSAWNKRNRNDEITLDGVSDLFSTNKMGGYSHGTPE